MDKSKNQAEREKSAVIKKETIFTGKIIALHTELLEWEGHKSQKWDIVTHPGAVVIVPVTDKGEILLVKQWRRAAQEIILELPAGTLEKQEAVATCAQRELQEETGYRAEKLVPLGGIYSAPGFCTEYLHLFIGCQLVWDPLPHDEDEEIDVCPFSWGQIMQMVDTGMMRDSKTLAGLFLYDRWTKTQK